MVWMRSLFFHMGLLSTAGNAATLNERDDAPTVRTSSGTLQGHTASWPANTTVVEFLGIPYAHPPTGDLRFAAPKAVQNKSDQAFVADKFSMDCMQFTGGANRTRDATQALRSYEEGMGGGSASSPHQYGEDCLSLNVWMKPNNETNKAVMVWIYGGGFSSGTTNAPFYSGARFAQDEDVVVVSMNYRINIFGFPGAPASSSVPDQNLGLLDQRMAVEWVRDNIAGFGGDPKRITLFGESAGGASVDLYAYAWTADPIVNGFIAQSGSASANPRRSVNASAWFAVSQALGCGGQDAGDWAVECMRQKSAADIINAVRAVSSGGAPGGSPFGPAADGKVVFADAPQRSSAGKFVKRPLLIGNNDFESGLGLALGGTPVANVNRTQLQLSTELGFSSPAARAAGDRAANGVPAWRYRYMAVWDNVALAPGTGAYHSSEIPIVFGTNPRRLNATADVPEEAALEKELVHAWAEFAKDPENGLDWLGWPRWDPSGSTLIRLGLNNQSAINFTNSTMYDSVCASRNSSGSGGSGTGSSPNSGAPTSAATAALMTAHSKSISTLSSLALFFTALLMFS